MVEVEPYAATPPEVSVHRPPRTARLETTQPETAKPVS